MPATMPSKYQASHRRPDHLRLIMLITHNRFRRGRSSTQQGSWLAWLNFQLVHPWCINRPTACYQRS